MKVVAGIDVGGTNTDAVLVRDGKIIERAKVPTTGDVRDGILAVPVIDVSSFRMPYADAAARSQVVRQVDEAARTVGFMQITGHGISAATRRPRSDPSAQAMPSR